MLIKYNMLKISLLLCLLMLLLQACDVQSSFHNVTSATPGATTSILDTWTQSSPGVEVRYEHWKSDGGNEDTIAITRFNLHNIHVSVGYKPANPLALSDWMKQSNARAIINGGYFDRNNKTTALTIADGQAAGNSYLGFGGMLAVDDQGHTTLRSLQQQPYDPDIEHLQQAIQSSPMLMINGQRTQFNANAASQRRSIVATDKQGRLLLIVSSGIAFSLDEMADMLVKSDLAIQTALNLDGGASTGLYFNDGNQKISIDPLTTLPIVIIVK